MSFFLKDDEVRDVLQAMANHDPPLIVDPERYILDALNHAFDRPVRILRKSDFIQETDRVLLMADPNEVSEEAPLRSKIGANNWGTSPVIFVRNQETL